MDYLNFTSKRRKHFHSLAREFFKTSSANLINYLNFSNKSRKNQGSYEIFRAKFADFLQENVLYLREICA